MNWNQARARQRAGVHKRSVFKPVGQPQVQAHDPTCNACGFARCVCHEREHLYDRPVFVPFMRDHRPVSRYQGMVEGLAYSFDRGKIMVWVGNKHRVLHVPALTERERVEAFIVRACL